MTRHQRNPQSLEWAAIREAVRADAGTPENHPARERQGRRPRREGMGQVVLPAPTEGASAARLRPRVIPLRTPTPLFRGSGVTVAGVMEDADPAVKAEWLAVGDE
jgi:hypothetical protein